MKQITTTGIVLTRTNFQEADRILTILTPDHGKVRVIAKGVRKIKSKLAGGIELLSVSDITYIPGRGDIATLVSTRLSKHYGAIVKDIERTMLAYNFLKLVNKATEDETGEEYFNLLRTAFEALNDAQIGHEIVELWFFMQLLKISGHSPNLRTDVNGDFLLADETYEFSMDDMAFALRPAGAFEAKQIKVLRLGQRAELPQVIANVTDVSEVVPSVLPLARTILQYSVRI